MKKIILLITTILLSLAFIACDNTTDNTTNPNINTTIESTTDFQGIPLYDGEILVSQVVTNTEGVTYLEVEGSPFLYIGSQIRVDAFMNTDRYTYNEIKPFFAKASELGVTCVQIPLEWKDIELSEGVFDFTYIDMMLSFANEYNLKLEFLWFGTNMCGDTHSFTVPDYIISNGKTYPKFDAIRTGEYWNYYGILWRLDFNDPDLLEKEANALTKSMEYVYEWDRHHEAKHPLIGVQILNEPDIFYRWRIEQYQVQTLDGELMTYEEGIQKVNDSLNFLGQAVKASDYKVYTRVNFASSVNSDSLGGGNGIYSGSEVKTPPIWAQDIFNLQGIDIVGDDSYRSNLIDIKGIINMYNEKLPGNFSHISENDGSYPNTPSLILTSIQGEGGYSMYDLVTSPFFIRNGSSGVDQGISYINESGELLNKEHFTDTLNIISALKKLGSLAITSKRENFIAFNIDTNNPETSVSQSIQTEHVLVNFTTNTGAIGYLVSTEDYLYVLVTKNSTVNFDNITTGQVDYGYFDEHNSFVVEGVSSLNSGSLDLSELLLYRVEITDIITSLTSNTWEYVG